MRIEFDVLGEIYLKKHRFRPFYPVFGRNLSIFYEISPEMSFFTEVASVVSFSDLFSLMRLMTLSKIAQSAKNNTTPRAQTKINCVTMTPINIIGRKSTKKSVVAKPKKSSSRRKIV